jgi:hypothetical protein
MAIDLVVEGMNSNTPFSSMSSGKIIAKSNSAGSYICKSVDGAPFNEFYVHTARWNCNIGDAVSTGQQPGYIATKAENGGYPMHIHLGLSAGYNIFEYLDRNIVFKTKYQDIANECFKGNINNPFDWSKYRDLSLDSDNMDFKIGDKIIFTGEENIRKGSGLKYDILSSSYAGLVGTIKDAPRIADGYTWYDVQFENGSTGWVADVGKFELYEEPATPPVTPPSTPDCSEYVKHIETLQAENTKLKKELGTCKEQLEAKVEEISNLEEQIKAFDSLIEEINKNVDDLQKKYDTLYIEKNRIENEKNKAIEGYNALKNGRFMWIVEFLEKLFPKK